MAMVIPTMLTGSTILTCDEVQEFRGPVSFILGAGEGTLGSTRGTLDTLSTLPIFMRCKVW